MSSLTWKQAISEPGELVELLRSLWSRLKQLLFGVCNSSSNSSGEIWWNCVFQGVALVFQEFPDWRKDFATAVKKNIYSTSPNNRIEIPFCQKPWMHCYVFEKEATNDCPFQSLCQMVPAGEAGAKQQKALRTRQRQLQRFAPRKSFWSSFYQFLFWKHLIQILYRFCVTYGCLWFLVLTTEGCGSCCGTSVQGGAFFFELSQAIH